MMCSTFIIIIGVAYSGTECCQCISPLKIETVIYKHKVVVLSREGKTHLDDELGGLRFLCVFCVSATPFSL